MKKTAVIVGADGQDGTILKNKLLQKKYYIISLNKKNFDICNYLKIKDLIKKNKPNEVYFLAAFHNSSQKKIKNSLIEIKKSNNINFISPNLFLFAISEFNPGCKFFFASSSLVFKSSRKIQDEKTLIEPSEIYGVSKAATMHVCNYYREHKNLFVNVGILYNHESIYRKNDFLSKKIVINAVKNYHGSKKKLLIGNLNSRVDWGSAYDYVDAIMLIQKLNKSSNYVIATGKTHKVSDFIKIAYKYLNLDYKKFVVEDKKILSRNIPYRCGNPNKLKKNTGWKPKINFENMIKEMVDHHLKINAK